MSGLGERLKRLRLAAGMSQQELAGDEFSASYVSLIEAGKRHPSPEILRLLARRLHCGYAELEGGAACPEHRQTELDLAYARLALTHGEAASARDRLAHALERDDLDPVTQDEMILVLAEAHEQTNDLEGAVRVLLPVFDRCMHGASHLPLAVVSMLLSSYYLAAGDLHAAVRVGSSGLEAVEDLGLAGTTEHLRLAATLMWVYYELGDLLHCAAWADTLMEVAAASESSQGQAAVFWNAAVVAEARGHIDEALHLCDRALALMTEEGTVRDLPRLRVEIALYIMRADPARATEAATMLDQTLSDLQDLGGLPDMADWEVTRGLAHLLCGDPRRAEQRARRALVHLGNHSGVPLAKAMILLGDSLAGQDRRDEAVTAYHAAGSALSGTVVSRLTAAVWREIAERFVLAEEPAAALEAYRQTAEAGGIRATSEAARIAFGLSAPSVPCPPEPVPVSGLPGVPRRRTALGSVPIQ